MIRIYASATNAYASLTPNERITSGMVGKEIYVDLSSDWDDLNVVAVCTGSGVTKDESVTDECFTLPHEVVAKSGGRLTIGLYGYTLDGETKTLVIPTVIADLGIILPGAVPSGESTQPASASLWEQAISRINADESSKVGYAEYSDSYLYLYDNSTDKNQISKLYIAGGSGSGISEDRCKEIIEGYGYATSASLTVYAKTEDLANYAKSSELSAYAKTTDLDSYAKVEDLNDYAKTANLATVATSGTYSDLSGRPTIGSANLTIQKNGTTVKTFSANATSAVTCNITVPVITYGTADPSGGSNGDIYLKYSS